jgi:hypothetical protein
MADNRQGGLVRVPGSIEQRGRIGDVPSSGAAEALSTISRGLDQVGSRVGALADHAAAVEGAEAGRLAGLDPEFRPTRNLTIRDEAYDKAGLDIYETRTKSAMLADLEGVYEANQNDPGKLADALAERRAGWVSGSIPELRAQLETAWDGAALTATRQSQRNRLAILNAEQKGAMTIELTEGLKRMSQKAYALGLDATADQVLGAELGSLNRVLARTDPTGKPLVDPSAAAKIMIDAKSEIATARINGAFSRLPSLGAKAEFITKLRDDFAKSEGIAAEYDAAGFERVVSSLETDYRSARATEAVGVRALKEDIDSTSKRLEKGFDPGDAAIAELKGRLSAIEGADGAADLTKTLAEAEGLLAWQKDARTKTPAALEVWAETERKALEGGQSTEFREQRLEATEKLLSNMRAELKQNAIGWADRVGLLKKTPLDFSSEETAAATMKARIAMRDEVSAIYGIQANYLEPEEARALTVAAAQGGTQMLQITTAIAGAAGDRTPKIIAEIAKDAPVVAMIAGHVNEAGATAAARDAADGIALSKTDGFKSMAPSNANAMLATDPVLGRSLSEIPTAEAAAVEAANAIYEVRARRLGKSDFDSVLWSKGLNEVLGQRTIEGVSFGGVVYQNDNWGRDTGGVILPPQVRSDGLPDLLNSIVTEDLAANRPRYADGSTAPVSEVRRAKLKNAGSGRYFLALGDPESDDPSWLLDADGRRYVLDLQAMLPTLGRRRPDLVLGGR